MTNSIKTAQSQAGLDFAHTADSRPTALNRAKKFILTLLALLTISTGAWADGEKYTVQFKANGNTKTVEDVTLPRTFSCSNNNANDELDLILKELYGWTSSSSTYCAGTVTPQSDDASKVVAGKVKGSHYITINSAFEGTVTVTGQYLVNSNKTSYSLEISIPGFMTLKETNTVATMTMPASDVTVTYELVRDLAQQVTFGGIPTGDGLVVKNNGTAYEFVTAPTFTLTDALADNADIISAEGITITTQKQGDGDTWTTLDATALAAGYAPGTYRLVATASADGPYDGTIYSDAFTTVEKYDLAIQPADEYSKGKLSEVTVAGAAQTLDADGKATVTNVAPGAEVKLKAKRGYVIEKVEAKKTGPQTLSEATDEDKGKIVGADGIIYATKADAEAAGTTAVAMIAYVGSGTDNANYQHGLAIALSDEGKMNWSTAKSTCEGKTAVSNAAWLLPSQNQWKAMFKANGGNDASCAGLDGALAAAGDNSSKLQNNNNYWSSTLVTEGRAYEVYLWNGAANWDGRSVGTAYSVRAVLAF